MQVDQTFVEPSVAAIQKVVLKERNVRGVDLV